MKHSSNNKVDTFKCKVELYKKLLSGSKMAKLSCIILVIVSFVFIFMAREKMTQVVSLLVGAIAVVFYVIKYLSLNDIKQKSYTQISFNLSLKKFKAYIATRKKYEIFFMAIWVISLVPFAIDQLDSKFQVYVGAIFYIAFVSFLGMLAFEKLEKTINSLEVVMDEEVQ